MLNKTDQKAYDELIKWQNVYINKAESKVMRSMKKVAKPIQPLLDRINEKAFAIIDNEIVNKIRSAIETAIAGAFQFTHDYIKYTYDKEYILKELGIHSFDQLLDFPVNAIDKAVKKEVSKNKISAAVEGAAFGAGELVMTLAELPILFAIIVRLQQQVCSCYGYDPESEFEQSFMLKVMSFSDAIAVSSKADLLLEMTALKNAIRRRTYKELSDMGGKYAIPNIAKQFARKYGKNLTKKKMEQAIPVIGAVVGGLFNYEYVHKVLTCTNNMYKIRYLEDKENLMNDDFTDYEIVK